MFRVPSSTPPSSPSRSVRNGPSTTPAGPPPGRSFGPSSTPGEPPPAMNSLFGGGPKFKLDPNNRQSTSANLFPSSPPKYEGVGFGSIGTSSSGRPAAHRGRTTSSGTFHVPQDESEDEDAEGNDDDDDDDDEEMDEEDDYDEEDMDDDGYEDEEMQSSASRRTKTQNILSESIISRTGASAADSIPPPFVHSGSKQDKFDLLALAKGLTPNINRANLQEPDHLILETERAIHRVHGSLHSDTPARRSEVLGEVAQELVAIWHAAGKTGGDFKSSRSGAESSLAVANRLARLLLTLHHPPTHAQAQRTSALALVPSRPESRNSLPMPKLLLDWLNDNFADVSETEQVLKEQRGYSRHDSFWEVVQTAALRGNFRLCQQLLQGANFQFAATARDDGLGDSGYSGHHLRYANDVVHDTIDLLRECPVLATEDWDVKGHDWTVFRQRVRQTNADLVVLATGEKASRPTAPQPITASHFNISQSQANYQLSTASIKAESPVPWSIFLNLKRLHLILLGNEREILYSCADWIEAVLALTVWWDGEEEQGTPGSLAASRRSIMRSGRVRPVDVTPVKAYRQRLSSVLAGVFVNADEEFSLNSTDALEVGIACIADNNIEGALQVISKWSLVIASATAELASAGEWFARPKSIMDQFDSGDLMVFNYTGQDSPKAGLTKDDLLVAYSRLLATKGQLVVSDGHTSKEGWELAIQILGRLDDSGAATGRIEQILDALSLESSLRVDTITRLCHDIGLSQQALAIAHKFADYLRTNTQNYGDTLMYYARAHDALKIQEVLRVLVAHCLVKSMAYPPPSELDDSLSSLITSPKQTLTKLASLDSEAASMLSNHLSGYATIRRFYDLRDEELLLEGGERPVHRPMARRRAAANALMVIIASAASSIRGGLYDPEIETVVQVDVLLALLGEALVFINQPKRTLTLRHLYDLLAAIEDLDTAPSMIRVQCEEVLSTTLSAAHDPSSSNYLQKSNSNITTASSQFSLIGSGDFGSADGQSTESSAVLVRGGHVDEGKRGWDWRRGFPRRASGEDIIRVLRLGIAKEIGRAFAEGEVNA